MAACRRSRKEATQPRQVVVDRREAWNAGSKPTVEEGPVQAGSEERLGGTLFGAGCHLRRCDARDDGPTANQAKRTKVVRQLEGAGKYVVGRSIMSWVIIQGI